MRGRRHYPSNERQVTITTFVPDAHGVQLANASLLTVLTSSPSAQGPHGFRPGLSGDGVNRFTTWTAPLQSFTGGLVRIQRPQHAPDGSASPQLPGALSAAASLNGVGKWGMR